MSELLDLLPPGSRTDADGMLIIGDCRADDLANEFGTPVLVVAEEALRARARECVAELTSRWPTPVASKTPRLVVRRETWDDLAARRETWDDLAARDVS